MAKTISIGEQSFETIRENDCFYIDKTELIKEWWESKDAVTLITRPRRFGKTLNMNMLECFFSNKYEGRGDLFDGLKIWEIEKYRQLQGTYPVIFLSFAGIKYIDYAITRKAINGQIMRLYKSFRDIMSDDMFTDEDREEFRAVKKDMDDETASMSINLLCSFLHSYYGKNVIVLMDEYDTPMQEAWVHGYWDEITAYIRALFNNTFKTNPHLERGIMTGITRVSKESIFSDLNNLNVATVVSDDYADCFGFTEDEVFKAMEDQGIDPAEKEDVKSWYDGFTFGDKKDIYNPWSVTLYLDKGKFDTYWANTSSNRLVGTLLRQADRDVKTAFESLLRGETVETEIDDQIVFNQLGKKKNSIYSLLLASGYLKIEEKIQAKPGDVPRYRLVLTNFEVKRMFESLILNWFSDDCEFDDFVSAMLRGDEYEMNEYMNDIALTTFSSFDSGRGVSPRKAPERFYHGFVLGLMVDRAGDYILKSNRESGLGRYDVVMEPKDISQVAVIMEFKVLDQGRGENSLEDTAASALRQIEEKKYDTDLLSRGIPPERIYKYGFAFEGSKCLIKKG